MSSLFLDSSATVPTVYELPAAHRAAMATLGARLAADPVTEPEAFGRQARLLARELPAEVAEALWAFEERGSDSGVLVLLLTLVSRGHRIATISHSGIVARLPCSRRFGSGGTWTSSCCLRPSVAKADQV